MSTTPTSQANTSKGKAIPPLLHDAISAWSNSFFNPTIPTDLIDQSTVIELLDERAKVLSARLLFGERSGNISEQPYDGHNFTNIISNPNQETLWLYGEYSPPNAFIEESRSRFQIDTGDKRRCPECRGAGKIRCAKCKGTRSVMVQVNGKRVRNPCDCGDGKENCGYCEGYGEVHRVITIKTKYKVDSVRRQDYAGEIPENKLYKSEGTAIFDESVDYSKEPTVKLIIGGVSPAEYAKLQSNISKLFHALISQKLTSYDGNIAMVHSLVDDFLMQMPNPCVKNKVLEYEIMPVRLAFKIIDVPVKKVVYTYEDKLYAVWVYGRDYRVHANAHPRKVTPRLVGNLVIYSIIFAFLIFWITGNTPPSPTAATSSTHSVVPGNPAQVQNVKSPPPAFEKQLKSAENGSAIEQRNVGHKYFNGEGVQADKAEALKWFKKAAIQGDTESQNILGVMYHKGTGTAVDFSQSVKWFRIAAMRGHSDAQCNLGISILMGRGVLRNPREAEKWLKKSSEQGSPTAQYHLGRMYLTSEGVEKDLRQAVKWLSLSAEKGVDDAKRECETLFPELTKTDPETLQQALNDAAEFTPKPELH